MAFLGMALAGICGLGSLVCFVLVIVQMFSNGESTMGIVSLVTLLCGIGGLIAFVYGWMRSGAWGIQNIMYAWTGCIVGAIIGQVLMQMGAGG